MDSLCLKCRDRRKYETDKVDYLTAYVLERCGQFNTAASIKVGNTIFKTKNNKVCVLHTIIR